MLLDTCQRALNRWVGESTAARECVCELEGSSFAIELVGFDLTVVLCTEANEIVLRVQDADTADARLRCGPLGLVALLRDDSMIRLKETGAELYGKVHVAETYARLLRFARPEIEDELAGWIGDVAAHEIVTASTSLIDWGRRAGRALEADVGEYLQHESGTLIGPFEARRFYADVDRLRDDVERAAERIETISRNSSRRN